MKKLFLALACLAPIAAHAQQPAGFQQVVASISTTGMSPAERSAFRSCKAQAQSVYQSAYARGGPIYSADMTAISYLRDCMISNAPGR